ncbi:hypothetical protein [Oxobacter pfennigii]|uniref:hypothetical protein n=1 Tax=Oxobacter pfennigii TaxID=36849 RepID=UPI0006D4532D|nr:hypothetical protein [Oxobacter pfennigii]
MREIRFIGVFLATILFSIIFSTIIPGGDENTKVILCAIAILTSVVAEAARDIIKKIDENKNI